jgi:neutral amino acid transport system permease protein
MTQPVVGVLKNVAGRQRAVQLLVGLLVALVTMAGFSSSAAAEGEAIRVQVKDQQRDAAGKTDNQPVVGVTVTVLDASGAEVGTAVTDDKGVALIPVPAKADYVVRIDESTLPDGLELSAESPAEQTVAGDSFVTATKIVNFFTGASQSESTSTTERIAQRFADGIRLGLIIAMCSVGLSLIFGTTGLTNFAHGEMVTVGALAAYFYSAVLNVPFILAAILALITCAILGSLQDKVLWKQLRRRGTGLIAMLVVSIGLAIFVRYLFLFFFGGGTQQFPEYSAQQGLEIGPLAITPKAIIGAIVAIIAILASIYWLLRTRTGKASRAVSDNPALASASGIDVEQVINVVWMLGATLAALAGILVGLTSGVGWNMGQQILLLIFAAVTVGGLGTAFGALLGSIIVGLLIQLSTLIIPPELKSVGALFILIIILLVRPQGLLGRRERVG